MGLSLSLSLSLYLSLYPSLSLTHTHNPSHTHKLPHTSARTNTHTHSQTHTHTHVHARLPTSLCPSSYSCGVVGVDPGCMCAPAPRGTSVSHPEGGPWGVTGVCHVAGRVPENAEI